jgi:NhaA family Na+:H+ antiporter
MSVNQEVILLRSAMCLAYLWVLGSSKLGEGVLGRRVGESLPTPNLGPPMQTKAIERENRRQKLGGFALIAAALIALIWANSPLADAYESMIHFEIFKEIAIFVFFLSVGIELRHEIRHGSMRNPRQAVVPIFAAMGGMALPVIIYSIFNTGQLTEAGWGIPMSTDIAFALAIYAIVGRGLPKQLRTFVMTVAVADDSLTILMIAIFFASSFNVLSIVSLAGVVCGLFLPGAEKLGPKLAPIVAYVALPIFALFSAGVNLSGLTVELVAGSAISVGIFAAMLIGKPLGVVGTAWLVTKSKLGNLAHGLEWADLRAVAWLFGMCFTVSLLMAQLAFEPGHGSGAPGSEAQSHSIGVLSVFVATTVSALISTVLMRRRASVLAKGQVNV